jgi:hypothetical protein
MNSTVGRASSVKPTLVCRLSGGQVSMVLEAPQQRTGAPGKSSPEYACAKEMAQVAIGMTRSNR